MGGGLKFGISDFVASRVPTFTRIKLFLVFWSVIFGLVVRLYLGALLAPPSLAIVYNSTLRVEKRKQGNAQRASSSSHEAEGDRELSSAGVRTRGHRPRILTARDNFQSQSPSAKCCELYASLHDRFCLEVRSTKYCDQIERWILNLNFPGFSKLKFFFSISW